VSALSRPWLHSKVCYGRRCCSCQVLCSCSSGSAGSPPPLELLSLRTPTAPISPRCILFCTCMQVACFQVDATVAMSRRGPADGACLLMAPEICVLGRWSELYGYDKLRCRSETPEPALPTWCHAVRSLQLMSCTSPASRISIKRTNASWSVAPLSSPPAAHSTQHYVIHLLECDNTSF
jgi:hypothetical protein